MSFLTKGRKQDLLILCEELGETVPSPCVVPQIKQIILKSEFYEEEDVKLMLERITEDRLKKEEQERKDILAQELRQHELELRRLEVSQVSPPQQSFPASESGGHRIQLTHIIPKFDEKQDEMSLYLINFERKAEMTRYQRQAGRRICLVFCHPRCQTCWRGSHQRKQTTMIS